jgi:hypothetical protein
LVTDTRVDGSRATERDGQVLRLVRGKGDEQAIDEYLIPPGAVTE